MGRLTIWEVFFIRFRGVGLRHVQTEEEVCLELRHWLPQSSWCVTKMNFGRDVSTLLYLCGSIAFVVIPLPCIPSSTQDLVSQSQPRKKVNVLVSPGHTHGYTREPQISKAAIVRDCHAPQLHHVSVSKKFQTSLCLCEIRDTRSVSLVRWRRPRGWLSFLLCNLV